MITYCSGDIFLTQCQTIAHGCNCKGVMGAGFALEIKKRFPECFEQYKFKCDKGIFKPGEFHLWHGDDKWILNMATQYSTNGADMELIKSSFDLLSKNYKAERITSLALPKIGAGLGRLDWNEIKEVLESTLGDIEIPVFVYEDFIPNQKFEENILSK